MGHSEKGRGIFRIISYVVEGLFANRKVGGVSFRKKHRERGFLIEKEEGQGCFGKNATFFNLTTQRAWEGVGERVCGGGGGWGGGGACGGVLFIGRRGLKEGGRWWPAPASSAEL